MTESLEIPAPCERIREDSIWTSARKTLYAIFLFFKFVYTYFVRVDPIFRSCPVILYWYTMTIFFFSLIVMNRGHLFLNPVPWQSTEQNERISFLNLNVILFQNSSILGIDIYNIMKCLSLQNKILLYLMTAFVLFFYTSDFSVYFQVF